MIITNNTTINLSFLKKEDFQFKFDSEFDATDTFKLEVGEIVNENYGFTADGDLTFARVDFSSLTNTSNTLTYKVYKNNIQIATGTVTVNLEAGGTPAGVIFNNIPSQATQVQVAVDTSQATNLNFLFTGCNYVQNFPYFDTSSATVADYMFMNCSNVRTLPNYDFSSLTNASYMFQNCTKLTDLSNLTFGIMRSFANVFYWCLALQKLPSINVANVTSLSNLFYGCGALKDFGGLINCKKSYSLAQSPLLTHDSLINCINGLADLTGETEQTLTLGASNLAKLSEEEIAVATNKNWLLN